MAVVAYYIHDDEEFDVNTSFNIFCDVDWEKSANSVLLLKDGLKRIDNHSKRKPGACLKPNCILFNVLDLEIGSSKFSLRSIGFSILPLDVPGLTCSQGYFQLPVYKHPFVSEMIDIVKPLEAWGLCEGLNKNDKNLKVLNCSLLVRLQLFGFEVPFVHQGLDRQATQLRHDELHADAKLSAQAPGRAHKGHILRYHPERKAIEENAR